MRHPASAQRAALLRLVVCLALLAQSLIPRVAASAAPSASAAGKTVPAAGRTAGRQEPEAADLPDLTEVRSRAKREPKAIPPIPSKRRRCPPRNPRCNDDLDGTPPATPTPTPATIPGGTPKELPGGKVKVAAEHAPVTLPQPHAWAGAGRREIASAAPDSFFTLLTSVTNDARPRFDLSLLDFISSGGYYSVSDAPARILPGAAYAAAPAAFLRHGGLNVAAAANGASATASTSYSSLSLTPDKAINGSRTYAGSFWNDQTQNTFPDWLQINFAATKTIREVDLFFLQDNLGTAEPTESMTFTQYGVVSFVVQYWTGSAWAALPNGTVTSNNKVWRKLTFSPVTTDRIRVVVNGASDDWSRIVEIEAYDLDPQAVPPQGIPPAESVSWTNAVNATPSDSTLTRTAGTANWDGGAISTKAIAAGDGYAEFTVPAAGANRMFGLSHGDSNQSYSDIDFAVHTQAGGGLLVYEAGVNRGQFGTCAAGDRLRVSVTGGVVSYSKNGVTFYTSGVAPRYPLLIDSSLYEPGATLHNVLISGSLVENVVWTNVAGVTAAGNNLSKSSGTGWNTGASSTRNIAGGDGYAEFTADTMSNRMFGLSRGDSNQLYTDIDFALHPSDGGGLYVFEAGVNKGYFGGYTVGDRLRVSVEGGQVRYRRNGTLLYTSATPPQYPLLVDTSLYEPGASVHNATISAPLPSQIDPGGTGLTGRYYDNLDFTNYVTTRLDYTVDYWWDLAAPAPGVGAEEFSVRWTGMIVPRYTETYTFHTTTDDGVRLWVDGQLIIDKWQDQGATEWTGQIALEAGRAYTIRMEFYDRFWGAVARLSWSSASQTKEVVPQSRLLPCWKSVEQFVGDFYRSALRREPTAYELQDWTERLAQAQGEVALLAAARALGRAIFDSTEYAGLNPSDNGRFAADLYRGFLQREPDAGGLGFWTNEVNLHGRPTGLAAFENSTEFQEKVLRLCGTAAAAGTNGGDGYNFAAARLDPSNRTGSGGTDAYSRNYNFSIPLVSLTGRAGLDLGLVLSYNSLVWTKDGTGVTFDADHGSPGPGFRLGFPTIQPKFYHPQAQKNAYLLVLPSGGRMELRQVGASNVYESTDSSYLQLTEGDMTLRAMDGAQLSFMAVGGEWRCYQVKDRNGNYISVAYYGDGRIWKVTDTLGRVLTFNYDNYQNLLSITQPWRRETEANPTPAQDEAHQWATFGYANVTLQPQFSNLAIIGEQPGTVIPALSQVGLDDGSYYRFSYNQWGQVWKVTHYAADSVASNGQPTDAHPLNSTRLNLPGSDLQAASAQTDCPRFTQERMWVENGVMNQSAEVLVTYGAWSANLASCDVTFHDGTVSRELYETTGWKRGLTAESQVWSGGVKKKWTTFTWDQDAPAAAFRLNPRVTQTVVNDDHSNQRRTAVSYQSLTPPVGGAVTLPQEMVEYKADATTVVRTTRTEYNLSTDYTGRRLIGLPSFRYVYEGTSTSGTLLSKVGYVYDDNTLANYLQGLPSAASQHDDTNYGTTFRWRGNVSRVQRYDVTGGAGTSVESKAGYYVTGTAAFTKSAVDNQISVSYADSYFQGINRSNPARPTYAYPTTVTDPDGYTATTSYNYDMGVVREVRTPLPNVTNNQPGPSGRRYYDAAGRLVQALNIDTGGYTRIAYPAKMDVVQTYTLIEAGVESYSAQVLDGAGRTRATARSLPGSAGGYAGQVFDYDQMGRLARQSNPTETDAGLSWAATGDDAAYGWLYTQTSYDWKGRPLVVTHPKVNPSNPNEQPATREFEYGGCGCAGGEVVTEWGELVPIPNTTNQGRRTRKVYNDALGRAWKVEVLDWVGNVYATTTTKFDALDRPVRLRKYTGATTAQSPEQEPTTEGSGYQTTTMGYDGHGRLQSRHTPEQNANTFTTYTYHADDMPATVTDGRGAVTTYGYAGYDNLTNNRRLVTGITHVLANSQTLTVSFKYDAAGNRKWMEYNRPEAGLNKDNVAYNYDVLSRLTKETRHFAGPTNADHELNYTYTLSGQLKTLTDPSGAQFTYGYDAAGQVTSVTGSAYAGVTNYATGVQYRASGGVKAASFGDNSSQTTAYDGRLRPSQYRLLNGSANWQRLDYAYNDDDRLRTVTDLDDTVGSSPPSTHRLFSLNYTYDHTGRVTSAWGVYGNPFTQSYGYDAFDNMTSRGGAYWFQQSQSDSGTYENNRRQGWSHDADGRLTVSTANSSSNRREWSYDAAGRLSTTTEFNSAGTPTDTLMTSYDGDGRPVREEKTGGSAPGTHYLVSSTVLGGEVVTRLTAAGAKEYTYVPAGGLIKAKQYINSSNGQPVVAWTHLDPTGTSEPGASYDPLGNRVVPQNPPTPQSPPFTAAPMYGPAWFGSGSSFANANNYGTGCYSAQNNNPAACSDVMRERMGSSFAGDLPGAQDDMWWAEHVYDRHVRANQRDPSFNSWPGSGGQYWGWGESNRFSNGARFVANQQNPVRQVPHPIKDADELRALMEMALKYGDCENKVKALIAQVAKNLKWKNDPFTTNVRDVLDKVIADGGLQLDWMPGTQPNMPGNPVAGGAGVSTIEILYSDRTPQGNRTVLGSRRYVSIKVRHTFSDTSPKQLERDLARMAYHYATTGIHEMLHLLGSANSTTGYGEEDYNQAAKELGAGTFDDYINKHCIPPNLRPNP